MRRACRRPPAPSSSGGASRVGVPLRLGAALLRDLPLYLGDRAQVLCAVMLDELTPLRSTLDIRGQGLLWGIKTRAPTALARRCREAGVVVYPVPRGVLLTPPLDMEPSALRRGMRIVLAVLRCAAEKKNE